jgi:hypothetical protein
MRSAWKVRVAGSIRPPGALLAVAVEDGRERRLVGLVDQLGRALPLPRHPHVEGPVGGEGEAAPRVGELYGRQAEVEDDAVEARDARRRDVGGEVAEAALQHGEPWLAGREAAPARDRGRVAVEAEHPPGAGIEDRRAVAAAAKGGVEIDAVRAHGERRQHLGEEHRNMQVGRWRDDADLRERSQDKKTSSAASPVALSTQVLSKSYRRRTRIASVRTQS